ncbi:Protein of uncharacterised function, DUF600 [Neisseria zoodegmatis]|uniref:Protein of uncharacterized function, DUF600 n=1 Tax=Neisseria zoodegmatis TaxID=326523 RepID=A0A378WUJ5_9NEIS|nr:immunity protein YezG family protein [Neisseria zoodegmatis]SUA44013.1 Protein of uncharacterised function, DUF600 [Neisseria zoodegmatis]
MLTDDQAIYQEIGKLLWSIMPPNALKVIYIGMFYDDAKQAGAHWISKDNQEENFYSGFDNPIEHLEDSINTLLEQLQKCVIFKNEPWTHCHISLSDSGKFNIRFTYVSKDDSWPNLFMRGVSDLTEDEAENVYYVPRKIWAERVRLKKLT